MKLIPLTHGKIAIVDDNDVEWLSQWKWHAKFSVHRNKWVAARAHWNGKRVLTVLMHRQILSSEPWEQTDHKNGNTLDNRRSNLRSCDASENCMNRVHRSGRQFRGVFPRKDKFRAIFRFRGKTYRAGTHDTAEAAALAYNELALRHCPEFAVLNQL